MMNIRNRAVNVKRTELLEALRKNLEIHKTEYAEALIDFKTRLEDDLAKSLKKVKKITDPMELSKFRIDVKFPCTYEQNYIDVIEMLEMSTDDVINIDSESFKAYIKNEWNWSGSFSASNALYKIGSFLSN